MKDLTEEIKSKEKISVPPNKSPKKPDNNRNSYSTNLPILNVRGFN